MGSIWSHSDSGPNLSIELGKRVTHQVCVFEIYCRLGFYLSIVREMVLRWIRTNLEME